METIKAPRHWPLCGEFSGDRWLPRTKVSNAENVSIWWRHHARHLPEFFGMTYKQCHGADCCSCWLIFWPWWRHQMETFSALLAICAENSPVAGEFLAQRPVTRSFDVFYDLRLNKRLNKQWWGWWFETPLRPLWRHSNASFMFVSSPVTMVFDVPQTNTLSSRGLQVIILSNLIINATKKRLYVTIKKSPQMIAHKELLSYTPHLEWFNTMSQKIRWRLQEYTIPLHGLAVYHRFCHTDIQSELFMSCLRLSVKWKLVIVFVPDDPPPF